MKNGVKTAVLLAALAGLLMLFGSFFGRGGLTIAFVISLAMIGSSFFFSDKIAIRSARAEEVERSQLPEYFEIMEELAQRADMPMPGSTSAPSSNRTPLPPGVARRMPQFV